MILVSLRDLQFRRRRFFVAILGTALVLGITLVLSGMVQSFDNEARRSTDAFHAADWVVAEGATGSFLSSATVAAGLAEEVAASSGGEAAPVTLGIGKVPVDGEVIQVNLHGVPVGSFASPPLRDGRAVEREGEIVVDRSLGVDVGEVIELEGRPFEVVGRTKGLSYRAGIPSVTVALSDAQDLTFHGADLATAIVSSVPVDQPPAGTSVLSSDAVYDDLIEPMKGPKETITMMQWMLWIVATMIVGSVVYLSALDRVRDFAVFKAMGASDRSVLSGLLAQSLLLCGVAYLVGLGLSQLIAPRLSMASEIPGYAYYGLALVALAVGVLSSIVGARRALAVDPALAFGGA